MGCSVGYWQSCSGCTECSDGYINPEYYPTHPKYRVPTGGGCHECKGRGVVFTPFTKADQRAWMEMAGPGIPSPREVP